jgi:hypothetical protein
MTSKSGAVIAMPLGFTDLVHSLRESVGLIEDIVRLLSGGAGIVEKRQNKKAAEVLFILSFPAGGVIAHLGKIAQGKGTAGDLLAIRQLLAESEREVLGGFARLDQFRNKLAARPRGMEIAEKVSEIVRGQDYGKTGIRVGLRALVDVDLSKPSGPGDAKRKAEQLLAKVRRLNEELRSLHGLILPP